MIGNSQEIWRPVKGYEKLYKVSNFGRIKKTYKNGKQKILKHGKNKQGYWQICLSKENIQKSFKIHRLVAQAFIKNPLNKKEVNHIDGNKNNNKVDNLEWCTPKENIQHAYKTGLKKCIGGKKINQFNLSGEFINQYNSIGQAQRKLKTYHIVDCCKGKRKTSGGYVWRYAND